MNRLSLAIFTNKLFNNWHEDHCSNDIINELNEMTQDIKYNKEKCEYYEAKMVDDLFSFYPYYEIYKKIEEFSEYIKSKNSYFYYLVNTYIDGIDMSIVSSMDIELIAHIYELLRLFYQGFNSIDIDVALIKIKNNLSTSTNVSCLDSISNGSYNQVSFIDETEKEIEVSQVRYNKKRSVFQATYNIIKKYYTEDTFNSFEKAFVEIINLSDIPKVLKDRYIDLFEYIKSNVQDYLQEKKTKSNEKLKLFI